VTLCTGLTCNDAKIQTVEHLMSALAGLGMDNIIVELSSAELPIMDGSAGPFVFLLQSAGIGTGRAQALHPRAEDRGSDRGRQGGPLHPVRGLQAGLHHPVRPPDDPGQAVAAGNRVLDAGLHQGNLRARTFGFMRDLEYMRERNLGLGGSMDNAIVLDEFRVLNEDGLRYADEFVRHKILDAIGDLYLAGGRCWAPTRASSPATRSTTSWCGP
jgi:UDP-3-O-[3-hydroxymyristoyl] N-acetylglucosamine deacetylase